MKIYIIGDTHFGHTELVTKYGARPEDFESQITRKWQDTVHDDDLIIHLGDAIVGRMVNWKLIEKLPSRKILVVGNHDRKPPAWYMTHGFDFACESFVLNMFGLRILFSHEPMLTGEFDLNIHGHLHAGQHRDAETGPRNYLFSLEESHYQPQLLRTLVEQWRKTQ